MELARERNIVRESPAPPEQGFIFQAGKRAADGASTALGVLKTSHHKAFAKGNLLL
jgi:hypothetical protein